MIILNLTLSKDFISGQDEVTGTRFTLLPETKNWTKYIKQPFLKHKVTGNKGE